MVYVLNKDNEPLMPTDRHGKVRRLLKSGSAKVVKRCPFTIQLLYETDNVTQEVSLGVDAGNKTIGFSATTKTKELYSSEVLLRNDIVKLLATRKETRRTRRNRLRYRKPRFNNRVSNKKNWLAPSIKHKINSHLRCIEEIHKFLPISKIVVEVASFDIQKIKNPLINGVGYQNGEMLDFWNVREYVLFRDGHSCRCCKGKSRDKILNVHHIESRKTGGDSPGNLITLCETCHNNYHRELIKLPNEIKRGMSFKDAAFMGIMRWAFYNELKELYENVSLTYGYITKNNRILNSLEKTHYIDARCISGNINVKPLGEVYFRKKVRCHNRQIHKSNILKNGVKRLNQAPYSVKGFRLFDKVKHNGVECFISGRRSTGYFKLVCLNGDVVGNSVSYKKLKLIEKKKNYLTERRVTFLPQLK